MSSTIYTCHYCGAVKFSLKRFLGHLTLQHEHLPNFDVSCHLCRKPYHKVESLRRHYYRKHAHAIAEKPYHEHDESNLTVDLDSFHDITDEQHEQTEPPGVALVHLEEVLKGLQKHITLFILKLQEKHLLPTVVQRQSSKIQDS